MKNSLSNMKSVITVSYKATVLLEPERKQTVSAPQHCKKARSLQVELLLADVLTISKCPNVKNEGFGIQGAILKELSHEIFTVIFWLEWIYLGMKGNRFWFLNFKDVFSILNSYFKYCCVSYQTFLEILRISED
jgi:hypothetical protein